MTTVYRYRYFCQTESQLNYIWDTKIPTICINNSDHIIDSESISIIDQVNTTQAEITNLTSDNNDTLQTVSKNILFSLVPFFGVSNLRNDVTTTGSGTISNNIGVDAEIKLHCSGSNDSVILRSVERGIYVPGLTCEVGIAIRIPNGQLTGNQVLQWGYFSKQNGFYFKLTSTDFQVCTMYNTVETCISRQYFNKDKVDGTGKSQMLLDFSKGNIFHIAFSWYGFGKVSFQVLGTTPQSTQSNITLHEYQTVGKTSTRLPNLPINISFANNGTVANTDVLVAGRQFSILGQYEHSSREITMYKYLCAVSHEVFLPLLSIRRKTEYTGCTIKLEDILIKSSVDCEVCIITKPILTDSSWVINPHATESACEVDTLSTRYSGGIIIYTLLCFANEICEHELNNNNVQLIEREALSIVCKSLTGENGSVTCSLSWNEYW